MRLLEVYDVNNEDGSLKCERLIFKHNKAIIQIGAYPKQNYVKFDPTDDFSFYYKSPCELVKLKNILNRIYWFGRRNDKKLKPRGLIKTKGLQ